MRETILQEDLKGHHSRAHIVALLELSSSTGSPKNNHTGRNRKCKHLADQHVERKRHGCSLPLLASPKLFASFDGAPQVTLREMLLAIICSLRIVAIFILRRFFCRASRLVLTLDSVSGLRIVSGR